MRFFFLGLPGFLPRFPGVLGSLLTVLNFNLGMGPRRFFSGDGVTSCPGGRTTVVAVGGGGFSGGGGAFEILSTIPLLDSSTRAVTTGPWNNEYGD